MVNHVNLFVRVLSVVSLVMGLSSISLAQDTTSQSTTQTPQPQSQALQQLQQLQSIQQHQQDVAAAMTMPRQNAQVNNNPPMQVSTNTAGTIPPNSGVVGAPSAVQSNPTINVENTGSEPQAEDIAFETVTSRLFPLTTAQVVQLREMYNTAELAQVTTPGTPPRPTATSQFVNLAPGSTPPVIRLAQGFVSSLVFLDSTGAPWPIAAYDLGDPKSFNIQWDHTGNTLMIQANKLYTYGNIAVRLEGLNTPVMMTLIPGQKAVDYRVDMRVQGYGPNAKMPSLGQNLPPNANNVLLGVLDGVPPPGSKLLEIIGGAAEAWKQGSKLYVRTRLTILSPGWLSYMSSADGMNAYEMQKTPILLVSWHGKVMQLKVEGL